MNNIHVELPNDYETIRLCLDIRGKYRRELEEYIMRCIRDNDDRIGVCKVIFMKSSTETEPKKNYFELICYQNAEHYHNPKQKDVLQYFSDFIKSNKLVHCKYCNETLNDKTSNTFCGESNYVCSSCERIGQELIIRKRMSEDLEKYLK